MRYLGTISPGNGTSTNNADTGTPFAIPAGAKALILLTPDASMAFACGTGSTVTSAAGTAAGFPLTANVERRVELGGVFTHIAIYNGSGGAANVRVWATF